MRSKLPLSNSAFTLVELLVSMTILAVIIVLITQVLSMVTTATSASNRQMDCSSLARIALDRFGNDFEGMISQGGATAVYYSESGATGNSAIGFVSKSRPRFTTSTGGSPTRLVSTDIRGATIGYRMKNTSVTFSGVNQVSFPMLNRGDGPFTFSIQSSGSRSAYHFPHVFARQIVSGTTPRLPGDLVSTSGTERAVNWQGMALGLLRMHISFVLSDGRVVQDPPAYLNFQAEDSANPPSNLAVMDSNGKYSPAGETSLVTPIAFSRVDSKDVNGLYVKGLIVGLVVLDESTLKLSYLQDNAFVSKVATKLGRPTVDGQSPMQVWNNNLKAWNADNTDKTLLPLRQNIRFFQRYYSVNR